MPLPTLDPDRPDAPTPTPARARSGTIVVRALAAASAIVAVAALAGCSNKSAGGARDSKGVVVKAGEWSVFDLRSGDCLNPGKDMKPGEIAKIPVVPCSDPHRQEVFASVANPADAFPGAAALDQFASTSCMQELQTQLGVAPADGYFVSYLLPSFDSWNKEDDKKVTCVLVFPTEGEVVNSTVTHLRDAVTATSQPKAGG